MSELEYWKKSFDLILAQRDEARAEVARLKALLDDRDDVLRRFARDVAERNPNPTDEYEQVGWLRGLEYDDFEKYDDEERMVAEGWERLYARRAVSSEDVYREAAE